MFVTFVCCHLIRTLQLSYNLFSSTLPTAITTLTQLRCGPCTRDRTCSAEMDMTDLFPISLCSLLNTCGNALAGDAPAWLTVMTNFQYVFELAFQQQCNCVVRFGVTDFFLPSRTWKVTLAQCNASCTPGYYCDSASLSTTFAICGVGSYSASNATTCSPCPPGTYGASQGLGTAACSGNCTAGYYCTAGSTTPTLMGCPPGQYSQSGWGACVSTQLPATERQSLVDLYTNTSGPTWRFNTGWSTYSFGDPCVANWYGTTWFGVGCSKASAITPYHVTYVLLVLRRIWRFVIGS